MGRHPGYLASCPPHQGAQALALGRVEGEGASELLRFPVRKCTAIGIPVPGGTSEEMGSSCLGQWVKEGTSARRHPWHRPGEVGSEASVCVVLAGREPACPSGGATAAWGLREGTPLTQMLHKMWP